MTRRTTADDSAGEAPELGWRRTRFTFIRMVLAGLLVTAVAACSTAAELAPTQVPPAPTEPTVGTAGGGAIEARVVLASVDLAVGANRFAFGVLDRDSKPIRVPQASATFMYIDAEPYEVRSQAVAGFVKWPTGQAGVYVVDSVSLGQAGRWGLVVEVTAKDGTAYVGQSGFVVSAESSSPAIGTLAPRSVNKTAADVSDLAELTSSPRPDADLYQMTIADAIESDKPTVITFATPAFCQTATCGPQVGVISAVKDRHRGQVNFIHVEVFDNLKEMEGDISKRRLSPVMLEWGLQTEPYTFILDGEGLVSSKFEGFVTEEEVESALLAVLGS